MKSGQTLVQAFRLGKTGELVAITGGGGKSSLLFALGAALPGRVILTTTTRIFAAQMKEAPSVVALGDAGELPDNALRRALDRWGRCLVVGRVDGEKALGVPPDIPGRLLAREWVDHLLVEADGSRMRPCKAPAEHEPVIPREATLVVPVIGIDALGGRLDQVAHRPDRVSALTGLATSDQMTVQGLVDLLSHRSGGLKGIPAGARVIPLINKVDTRERLIAARKIARRLLKTERFERVVLGAVREKEPLGEVHGRVTAVILAAGTSSRMGQAKLLMQWGKHTILGQTLENLAQNALHERLVVTGHNAGAVGAVAAAHGARVIHNPDYENGEMLSSLKAAVQRLPANREAVLVVLADQPMVGPELIEPLLEAFWRHGSQLIAPTYRGQRGNPVLIGRDLFEELLNIPDGGAPRILLQRHPGQLRLVEVDSEAVLRDIDLPEQYRDELKRRGLDAEKE